MTSKLVLCAFGVAVLLTTAAAGAQAEGMHQNMKRQAMMSRMHGHHRMGRHPMMHHHHHMMYHHHMPHHHHMMDH